MTKILRPNLKKPIILASSAFILISYTSRAQSQDTVSTTVVTETQDNHSFARGKSTDQILQHRDSIIKANQKAMSWELCACERGKDEGWRRDMNWSTTYEGAKSLKSVTRFSKLVLGQELSGTGALRAYYKSYFKCIEAVSIKYLGYNTTSVRKSVLPEWAMTEKIIVSSEGSYLNYSVYPLIREWIRRGVMTK